MNCSNFNLCEDFPLELGNDYIRDYFCLAMNAEEHIQKLKEEQFMQQDESLRSIRSDLHQTQLWADVFWRRRKRHAVRIDAELDFIPVLKPTTILEIGSGYGRILAKIGWLPNIKDRNVDLHGIEVCGYFKPYFQIYQSKYPQISSAQILWDDFFKTRNLQQNFYDMIVLPMNTINNFSFLQLGRLLSKVKQYLAPDGTFIFTTHNFEDENYETVLESVSTGSHDGELLLDGMNNIIVSEFFELPAIKTNYGAKIETYTSYNRLSRDYVLLERNLFRNTTELILRSVLENEIVKLGFRIVERDDRSHSVVYVLKTTK